MTLVVALTLYYTLVVSRALNASPHDRSAQEQCSNFLSSISSVERSLESNHRGSRSAFVVEIPRQPLCSPCFPHHGVLSYATSAEPIVFCTHDPNEDIEVSRRIAADGVWVGCIGVARVLMALQEMVAGNQSTHIYPAPGWSPDAQTLFIDVGANIGACTMLVAHHQAMPDAAPWLHDMVHHIIAVEPLKGNIEVLKSTLRANRNARKMVTIAEAAVLDHSVTSHSSEGAQRYVALSKWHNNFGNTTVKRRGLRADQQEADEELVALETTLDDVVVDYVASVTLHDTLLRRIPSDKQQHGDVIITLLKIDVQGGEYAVLQGAQRLFEPPNRVDTVLLEVEPSLHRPGSVGGCIRSLTFLFDRGFRIFFRAVHRMELVNATIGNTFIARGFWEKGVFEELRKEDDVGRFVRLLALPNATANTNDMIAVSGNVLTTEASVKAFARHLTNLPGFAVRARLRRSPGKRSPYSITPFVHR